MERLIDADALDNELEALKVRFKALGRDNVVDDYNFVQIVLLTAPTVDAVEVVRCKNCGYAKEMEPIGNSGCLMGECHLRIDDDVVTQIYGDDFCSYGERRDNHAAD